jgi:hypothetical protein
VDTSGISVAAFGVTDDPAHGVTGGQRSRACELLARLERYIRDLPHREDDGDTSVGSAAVCPPNGRSIVLERQQGADAGGYSGLEDEIDNHWAELFKAALLSTILGVGAELGSGADTGSNTDIIQALRLSAANSLNQTGQQVVRRNLNIQPTLTIRPGFPVRVIVNRDLVLEPYRG